MLIADTRLSRLDISARILKLTINVLIMDSHGSSICWLTGKFLNWRIFEEDQREHLQDIFLHGESKLCFPVDVLINY